MYEDEIRSMVERGKLEVHLAFSRDRNGILHDRATRTLVEKKMNPRYVDSAILDAGAEIADIIAPVESGGLGGYIYICGSASFYETVSRALLKLPRYYTGRGILLEKAFSQGRVMLDIFTPPRPVPSSLPMISITDLARNTGHRDGRMWIAVHGKVYDVTGFLPIHPGGPLIISTNAGQDCSTIFDRVGHTSNGEVMALLSNYLLGRLAPVPRFASPEINSLCEIWRRYVGSCVESLTTVSLEIPNLQDQDQWFKTGMFDMCMVRKLYQFQSRFMENIIDQLFGARYRPVLFVSNCRLREIYLKVSTMLLSSRSCFCPDIIGVVTLAQTSKAATRSRNKVAKLGEFLSCGITVEDLSEGIVLYSRAVTELEVKFLEQIRDELCLGIEAFSALELQQLKPGSEKQVNLLIRTLTLGNVLYFGTADVMSSQGCIQITCFL